MNEGSNKSFVEAPKQETQKLEITSVQPTLELQPKEEKGSLSSQVEALLSGTELASRQQEFLNKIDELSDDGEKERLLRLLEKIMKYQPGLAQEILDFDLLTLTLDEQITPYEQKLEQSYISESVKKEQTSQKEISQFISNNIEKVFKEEFGILYGTEMKPEDLAQQVGALGEGQKERFQTLLNDVKSQPRNDSLAANQFSLIEKQLEEILKNIEVKEENIEVKEENIEVKEENAEVKEENAEVKEENREVKEENTLESKIRNASNNLNELGSEKAKTLVEKIFEHGKVTQELKNEYNSGDEKKRQEIISNALNNIAKTNNTQAIEDILMVAAQADPKGVEGETFKAFYAVFETSGVAPDVLVRITNKIEKSSLSKEQQKAYFTGVTSEPTEDEKGFLTYENQKIDLSEIPPVRYIKTQGNLEIKSTDKEYYTALREKNQKEHRLDTAYKELDQVQSNISRIILQNADFTKELDDKLNQLNSLPSKEDPRYDGLSKEIDKLEDNIERNKISLEQNKKNQAKLLQEISVLPGDIARLSGKINDRELFLTEKKINAQKTANFLDYIGFTQIPKDDIDWMLSQVNAFDATYYGFSQPLNFENGFDYQSSKGYQEFITFFNTLLFGKDKANHKIPNDYKKFTNGTDISNAAPSFQQLLKQQGVLREDGRLNQFNFFQKFSSRNAEKQPTANAPKEGSEAKQ